jgi:class 3 adenylate cyclase
MREALPLEEFAALVGARVEELEDYRIHGLLDLEHDGLFDDLDVIRLDTIRHFLDKGLTASTLAEAIAAGTVSDPINEIIFDAGPTYTLEEAAASVGADVEQLRAVGNALGFGGDTLRDRDREVLEVFKAVATSGLPFDAIVEGARVMGDTLRRLAETEVRLVHVYVHERLVAAGASHEEVFRQISDVQGILTPLLDPLIQHVHRYHLVQAAIEDIFLHLTSDTEAPSTLGSVQAAIVFADVASFTELADAQGDEAAATVLARLDGAVRTLAFEHEGKVVKQLGDGFMLVFRRSADAVRFAVGLDGVVRRAGNLPAIRIGINTGSVLHRADDYVGSAVNLASRVMNAAMAGQILVTDTVVGDVDDLTLTFEEVGVRLVRGIDAPLALWRVTPDEETRDPVCGAEVGTTAAARLTRNGQDVAFCSEDCLRRFVENPARYAAH